MTATLAPPGPNRGRISARAWLGRFDQAYLVLIITVLLAVFGGATKAHFFEFDNLTQILSNSAAVGIMAIGIAIVVLGKGLDLSVAGVGLGCSQATLALMHNGMSEGAAITWMMLLALGIGLVNGVLVAYLEMPPLFVTLATGMIALGSLYIIFLDQNVYSVPQGSFLASLNGGHIAGIPRPVIIAAIIFVLAWLFIAYTVPGSLIRAMGDNFDTARSSGAPVRPLQVGTYMLSAVLAVLAVYVQVAIQGSEQTTSSSFAPILFTALTVVVIGGVSLSGGRGTILGVLAGALFVGVLGQLLNMYGLSVAMQNLVQGAVLVAAVGFDAWLHPRNDETEKSGEL